MTYNKTVFLDFFMGLSILLIDNAAMKDRKKEKNKERLKKEEEQGQLP